MIYSMDPAIGMRGTHSWFKKHICRLKDSELQTQRCRNANLIRRNVFENLGGYQRKGLSRVAAGWRSAGRRKNGRRLHRIMWIREIRKQLLPSIGLGAQLQGYSSTKCVLNNPTVVVTRLRSMCITLGGDKRTQFPLRWCDFILHKRGKTGKVTNAIFNQKKIPLGPLVGTMFVFDCNRE